MDGEKGTTSLGVAAGSFWATIPRKFEVENSAQRHVQYIEIGRRVQEDNRTIYERSGRRI